MKMKSIALLLALCLMLTGCYSWLDGSYSSSKVHQSSQNQSGEEAFLVKDEAELTRVLTERIEKGAETVLINVTNLESESLEAHMGQVVSRVLAENPFAAYAVEAIVYELGTSGSHPALAITIQYNQNRGALRNMTKVTGIAEAERILSETLERCETKVVMYVEEFRAEDFQEFVRKFMDENPQTVMELPNLTISTFPESGEERVVEIGLSYQTGREDLKMMQSRVAPLFTSAELYVSGNSQDYDKYEMLYTFLMERHDYQVETSITPSYSLLIHGVGNSKAFAVVYASMCRNAGLECKVVSGTCNGESHFWNMVCVEGVYRHLDLLASNRNGALDLLSDQEMVGYVWDYSAYPECEMPEDPDGEAESNDPNT